MVRKRMKDKKIEIYEMRTIGKGSKQKTEYVKVTVNPIWAYYRQLSGDILFQSHSIGFKEEVTFTINWRNDIRPGMFVKYAGKTFYITRLDDFEGYKRDISIFCKSSSEKLD